MNTHLNITHRIRSRLNDLGTNPSASALNAGLSRAAVKDILEGRSRNPRIDTLIALCGPLKCSLAELLGIDEISPTLGASSDVSKSARISELRDEIETAFDLLTALDKTGDGIGGDIGHGVSAVALAARAALDNARSMLKAMEGAR